MMNSTVESTCRKAVIKQIAGGCARLGRVTFHHFGPYSEWALTDHYVTVGRYKSFNDMWDAYKTYYHPSDKVLINFGET